MDSFLIDSAPVTIIFTVYRSGAMNGKRPIVCQSFGAVLSALIR